MQIIICSLISDYNENIDTSFYLCVGLVTSKTMLASKGNHVNKIKQLQCIATFLFL